ncbi:hypothetical protein Goklo_020608 [Gossypium klotzschianum]|uniref:RING-type domain-containing protein n=1 Tax=Gossypium klotzschianum TaxID=34286 RepID=A0A7J8UST1_9ROSI|nr:hypothetical protein [Gossypium klotzschianum]
MDPAKGLSLNSHRLILTDQNSPHNDQHLNVLVDRIWSTVMVAVISLGITFFLIYKCIFRSPNHSSDKNKTEPKPSVDSELDQIPVLVYGESMMPSSEPSCSDTISELETCAICLEEYVHGERVRVLPRCKHMFHKDCIEEWLEVPSLHCPICRDKGFVEVSSGKRKLPNGGTKLSNMRLAKGNLDIPVIL